MALIELGFPGSGATFSADKLYRYRLWRVWDASKGVVLWIGLNPSTADEHTDDPTIRRCVGFTKAWGYGGLFMMNLFAYRATDPKVMKRAADPVGPDNDDLLLESHGAENKKLTVAAWGNDGHFLQRAQRVRGMLTEGGEPMGRPISERLLCLGLTKNGHPKHPLYLPANAELNSYWAGTSHI